MWSGLKKNSPLKGIREIGFAVVSDQYDFTISLLHLDEAVSRFELAEEPEEDAVTRMANRTLGASWLG